MHTYPQENVMKLSYCSLTKSMLFCPKIKVSAEPVLTIYSHDDVRPWNKLRKLHHLLAFISYIFTG